MCCTLTQELLTLQGRMCLLLGPPGSGKSSLLKLLAGKIRGNKLVQVSCTRPYRVGPYLFYLQTTAMYSEGQAEHNCHAENNQLPQMANAVASISETHCILWQVKGDVLYNGKNFKEFVVERSSGYVEQTDQHYPPLTVRETLDFAAWCQGTGCREGQ